MEKAQLMEKKTLLTVKYRGVLIPLWACVAASDTLVRHYTVRGKVGSVINQHYSKSQYSSVSGGENRMKMANNFFKKNASGY